MKDLSYHDNEMTSYPILLDTEQLIIDGIILDIFDGGIWGEIAADMTSEDPLHNNSVRWLEITRYIDMFVCRISISLAKRESFFKAITSLVRH